jgi:hypothetical protein
MVLSNLNYRLPIYSLFVGLLVFIVYHSDVRGLLTHKLYKFFFVFLFQFKLEL